MHGSVSRRRHARIQALRLLVVTGTFLVVVAAERTDKIVLLPRLQNGQTLRYESHARVDRHVETKSNVATMLRPGELRRDLSTGLRLSVQEFRFVDNRPMLAGETELRPLEEGTAENPANNLPKVNFTISRDGGVTLADGLDDLDPEQRLTWQFWVAQFAFSWTLPASGVKPGEKWKSEEIEKTPTPIANLVWERETTYVQNDQCPDLPSQPCAVFLIAATLKQKSNPKDTTPEDYRLHELKTSGMARGTNETLAYISLETGLLVRATEDLQQSMEVTIAKADGSNQVHYEIQVTSHFETVFVPSTAPSAH